MSTSQCWEGVRDDTSTSSSSAISFVLLEWPVVWTARVLERSWIGWESRFVVREGSMGVLSVDIAVIVLRETVICAQSRFKFTSDHDEKNLKNKINV